ncbi:trypsin-like serine protease [Saccharothrix hoggarensis]|uniref:Trypsin-like serine protease n=1 Tax=Saccharothrix hoggarensis TaxID=913853 RepID=A0ABW3QMS6_9PSEU
MRRASVAAAVVAIAAVTATPASAINTYNATPAPERTEVGALVATWDNDDNPATPDRVDWVCSGAMVDRDTFLTAAHCTTDWPSNVQFYVSLEQDVQSALDRAPGTPAQKAAAVGVRGVAHNDPDYPGTSSDPHDISVVEVPARQVAARWSFTPATLPSAGLLDAMGPRALDTAEYTAVGYGTQEAQNGPGGHTHPGGGVRMKATLGFNALNNNWLRLSMIESQGYGGACYGDSGGPNFATIGGKRVLVATTITGDAPCYATNVTYRLDAPAARSFLAPFVALP